MKPIYIFIFFVCLIYTDCQLNCDSYHCITDGFTCQDRGGGFTCNSNCKPKYGDTTKCYDCSSISTSFYKITIDEGIGPCLGENSCQNGFIESSKECIESTNINNLFHIGNVYYKECPDNTIKISSNECKCAYKFYIDGNDLYHCLSPTENCPSGYEFYDYETGECIRNCDTTDNQKYVKNEVGIKRCYSSCIGDEFYYGNSVPLTCTDYCDKLIYFDTSNRKHCSDSCPENYKKKNNNCVPNSQCQFYDSSHDYCLNSCEESNNKLHKYQSNECISICDNAVNGYNYLKDNICYKEEECNYIQEASPNKKCLSTCNVEDGFIVPNLNTPNQCYTSCPPSTGSNYKYYNHGENKCMQSCSETGNNKIYHKNGGFECFSSCKDIDDGTFIYLKKNDNDYICYDSIPDGCGYYIRINNGINKCLTESSCPGNYKYLKGLECLEECDDYKAIYNENSSSQITKCFVELNDCFSDYKFYNINEKKCWKNLPFGYCKKPNKDDTSNIFEVVPISDNYYYEDNSGDKYCVNSCQSDNKFIDFIDKKKCIAECSKGSGTNKKFFYYDPRNKECLETCIGSGLEFAYKATDTAQSCLISNGEKYYFENDKLLIDSCTLYKAPGSKICVSSCQPNEKINNNHECSNGCPSTAPYINENNECKSIGDDCPFISEIGNKCISSCNVGEGFVINEDSNHICYNACPVGTQYHDLNNNECISNCGESNTNKYYINGEYVCYSSSCGNIPAGPNGKYLYETTMGTGGNNYYSCSDIIPPTCNKYFIENDIKKCKADCNAYRFMKGKECLNLCNGYKANYQAAATTPQICLTDLDECFINNYIYYNTQSKQCWDNTHKPATYYIISINFGNYEIVTECSSLLVYQETEAAGGKNYCYSTEQCKSLGKYKCGQQCIDTCENPKFIYNSECLDSCGTGQGHDYHNYNSNLCISGCSGDHPYHKENENEKVCYNSCNQIEPTPTETFKYLRGFICSSNPCQYYHEIGTNMLKCYESEDECIKAGYNYLKGNECLLNCGSNDFKVMPVKDSNGIIISLGKCFDNVAGCRSNEYYFYNHNSKECWFDTCKNDLLIMQLDAFGHPEENIIDTTNKETCVSGCPTDYYRSGKYCLKNSLCSNSFLDEDLGKCVSDCGDKYLIRGTNKCKSQCNNYYFINNSGKKECLAGSDNCQTISKFYFPGNSPSKCIDECYILLENGLKKYLFYDSTDNKCVESCLNFGTDSYADEPTTTHQNCKDSCGTKYYYENEKICRDTPCILFKDNTEGQKICVTECEEGKKVSGNKCADSCSENFFVEQKIEIKGLTKTIKKCVSDCLGYSSEYEFIYENSSNENECLKTCNEGFIKIGHHCYKNVCDKLNLKIFFNPSDKTCDESCSDDYYEKLSDNSDIYICKSACDSGQFKYLKDGKYECLSECPEEAKYIHQNNECKSDECNNKILKIDKGSYKIYECIDDYNLCSGGGFYSDAHNKCFSICKGNDEGNPFSLTIKNEGNIIERKCFIKCSGTYKYYKEDKKCLEEGECEGLLVEHDTNKCVESCNGIQFIYNNECWDNCPNGHQRYISPNNECMDHCPEDKNYHPLEGGFECFSGCKEGEYKDKIAVTVGSDIFTEYNCVSNYRNKKYYKIDRILRDNCENGHYVVEDTNECVENCNKANTDDKTYFYYEYEGSLEDNDYQVNTCTLSCKAKKPFYEDGHCKKECRNNLYFKEGDKICLPNCPEGYYKNGNICVNSCKEKQKFLYSNNICVDYCPSGANEKKFYIESDYECIQDCTLLNSYYTEIPATIESGGATISITKYKCHGDCNNYYIVDENPNVIAKKCLPSGQTCVNQGLYSNADKEKECYTVCPSNKYFDNDNEHTDSDKHKKCSSKCLEDRYHEIGSMECKHPKDCSTKFADFDTNKCVTQCNTTYYSEIIEGGQVKYTVCLNQCNGIYGTYITPDNRCVKNCISDFDPNSQVDGNRCKCQHLYYYDDSQKKTICLDKNDDTKKDYCFEVGGSYPNLIQIFGTEQCIKTCNDFPSLNGEFCYKYENEACRSDIFDTNSKLMNVESRRKCDCPYKFYIDSSTHKKYCLSEFDTCTQTYSFYVPETRQCVNSCSDTTYFQNIFKKYCLRSCPIGSEKVGNECKCPNYWYSSGNSFHCLEERALCPDSYPFYAPLTKECLKKCKGSYYPYLFKENECYTGCEEISSTMTAIDVINNDYVIKKCVCERPWYYKNGQTPPINCPDEEVDKKYCSDYFPGENIDFMIHDTKECVEKCPSDHPYYFNQECFTNCENDAEMEYHYVTKKGSYECQCKNLWHYIGSERTKKECTTHENMCFGNNIGNENKDFLMFNTNECIGTCLSGTYIFNMTCYNKCPDYTVENTEDHPPYTCSCNKDIDAYWYEYKYLTQTFYVCGVKTCPINNGDDKHNRPYLVEEKKQCVKSCQEDANQYSFQYNLRKFCVKKCPENTNTNDVDKLCEFKNLNSAEINNKEDLIKYANVQSKELYERSGHLGGFLYDKFDDVSLQIYEINKDDTLKELSTKSNLTYIDFDTCLPKIYKENKLKDDDNIIVTKYDLKYWITKKDSLRYIDEPEAKTPESDNKFLINRVEYEFYNSRTMKKLDASVCDPYEILISYPLVFNKNKYDDYDSGFNNNEYKKKLEMGKKLHQRNNEYDTFNPNNTLYKEFCTGIELDGKDLVFEDRYNVLYPNGALLCETNCTYNSTDFEEERVNCKCTYKQEIDLDRVIEEKNDLVNDPNFHVPEQSSSNLEIVKCISKLRIKDAILNNEAFYYCASVAVVAVSMVFVTAFYGIKAVGSNISGILNKFIKKGNNDNIIDVNVFQKKNVNKYDNNLSTSNRILSNPPRKAGNNIKNEDDKINTGNIIENKDIAFNYQRNSTIENENDSKLDDNNNILNIDYNYKAEYLPLQYNFKYFKSSDKGVIKKIERSKLPFKVNQNTKYLLERKNGVTYHENYLNGPFLSSQNIIEIIDKENEEIIIKNNNNELYIDNDNKSPTKNNESQKKRNLANNKLNLNMNMSSYKKNQGTEEKEKDFINIKKIKLGKNDNNTADNDYEEEKDDKPDDNAGLYTLIKREQILLRVSYKKYLSKEHKNILSIFLAEILDKVYLVKICLFLKKYEIFGVHLTLYLFCHLLLLTLSCSFFTIGTIKKIWEQDNFPGIQFYLLYGLISNIAVWAIYKIFLCLLDMQDKIKELVELQNKNNDQINADENINEINNENVQSKFIEVMKNLKCKIIIFYCIIFVFIILFALYLISFFSIYTGTKSLVLETYIISIIEILLIKLVYGICLASLRIASEGNELICLYKLVYILDKYLS